MKYEQKIFGEYVATPIKNAFNEKTAYWLSKANCMVSIYMFTCENGYNEKEMFSDMNLAIYIAMLEEKCIRLGVNTIIFIWNMSIKPPTPTATTIHCCSNSLFIKMHINKHVIRTLPYPIPMSQTSDSCFSCFLGI